MNVLMQSSQNWTDADETRYQKLLRLKRLRSEPAPEHAAELRRSASDICHWVDQHCRTYDPRRTPADIPFKLFPRQAEFLRWLEERERQREHWIAEKSRDVGFTWLCVAFAVHRWLFRPGVAIGFGSRKLELVDRLGDPDSILEKARYLLRHLPHWMLPAGWESADNWCRILNPSNGSTITGEGGDNIGRGGRKSMYFVDEAAFLEHPQKVEAALSQTSEVIGWLSTPNGPGNPFAVKRHSGRFPVFTFHWRDDLRKGAEWYARQKEILDPVTLAQEIDIDYSASVEGICIPAAWARAAVGLDLPASGPVICGFDVAEEGKNRNVLIARQGPRVLRVTSWSHCNTTQSAWRAAELCEQLGGAVLNYDCIGVGAGVRGTLESSERELRFAPVAVNGGEAPTGTIWPDGKTSKERFLNRRAEVWWSLRRRFERAYEHATEGVDHPAEDMISLPEDVPDLLSDLSLPLYAVTDTGKIKIESKDAMAKRGVKSPDFADALAYAFALAGPRAEVTLTVDAADVYRPDPMRHEWI